MNVFLGMTSPLALAAALLASPAPAQGVPVGSTGSEQQVPSTVGAPAAGPQAPTGDQADAASASNDGVGDIIVTAQRRSESLQRVPASVEVVSGAQLQAAHINNLANVQELSPSLIVTQSSNPSAGVFTIRGIGTAVTDRGFEQSVGVYIDGVFRGRPGAALQNLLDIDRVEVLRGPQSTLFGRNNAAGAINISTSLPDLKELGVYAEGTYGNYDAVQARLSVSVPIVTDKLAIRIAVSEDKRDGFLDAPNLPRGDVNSRDRQSIRGQLYWAPTDTTRVRLIGDYSQFDDRCCSYTPLFVTDAAASPPFVFNVRGAYIGYTGPTTATRGVSPSNPAAPGVFYNPFARRTTQDNPSVEKASDKGVSLEVDQDVGALTVTAIGAHRLFSSRGTLDIDGVNSAVENIQSNPTSRIREDSAELRVQNQAGQPLEFILGGYYFNQSLTDINVLPVLVKPIATTFVFFNSNAVGKTESGAVFGQATYNLSSAFRVTGGLRYLNESKDADTSVGAGNLAALPLNAHTNNDALMGTASVAFQPTRDANFYARYSRGYKSAAINLLVTSVATQRNPIVNPETTDAYEVGAKLRLFDDKLSANVAVYTQTVNDQQVQAFNSSTASFITLNAAKVRSRGVEADALFRPIRPLTFSASVSYLDAKYKSFPGAPPQAGAAMTIVSQDLTGQAPPNAPQWTLVGGVNLDQPLTDSVRLLGNVSLRHATSYYTDVSHTEAFRNGNTDTLTASVELALANGFGLQFWGRNLTKENYILTGIGTPGGTGSLSVFTNDPRTYGVTLRFRH